MCAPRACCGRERPRSKVRDLDAAPAIDLIPQMSTKIDCSNMFISQS